MRRLSIGVLCLGIIGVATACPAQPTTPYTVAPVIASVVVTPAPAVPGQPFQIQVSASHPLGIFKAEVLLIARSSTFLPGTEECATAVAVATPDSGPNAVMTINCTLPTTMQNGSDWFVRVNVMSMTGTTTFVDAPFTVAGGTDDIVGPVITPDGALPTSATIGTPFTFGVRLTDDHPAFLGVGAVFVRAGGQLSDASITCTTGPIVPVDATSSDVSFTCVAGPDVIAGAHLGYVVAADALAQASTLGFEVILS